MRRTLGILLAGVLPLMACHSAKGSRAARADSTPVPSQAPEPALEARSTVPPPPPPLSADEVPPVHALDRPLRELAAFYDAMDALRRGQQPGRTLRILWMGDSHTSADFMTHRVRLRLQALGGDAGPGFLRLGLDAYRHEGVSFEVTGKWRQEPALPAQRTRVKDGVFGYGGIRTLPQSGARIRVGVSTNGAPDGTIDDSSRLRFRLAYRLPAGSAIDVRVGRDLQNLASGPAGTDPASITYLELEGAATDQFELAHVAGAPEIFGVFVERLDGGVAFDTVGIDGARAATPLAWEPEQFVAAVQDRAPSLVVLAYGTNEVFDKTNVSQYVEHLVTLVARVRAGAGPIPCWIIGPMDAPGPGGTTRPRVAEVTSAQEQAARAAGCAFTSAQSVMGGEGSFLSWTAARPQLARTDGIHLTIAGYRKLGDLLADQLLAPPLPPRAR